MKAARSRYSLQMPIQMLMDTDRVDRTSGVAGYAENMGFSI